MTEVLTVPTHFEDLAALSQGLVDRVGEGRLILYGPAAYDEGSEIGFSVLLLDGNAALEGRGRVERTVDGGDGRAPEIRYDIVLDTLQLEGASEYIFERIVQERLSMQGGQPNTAEVMLEAQQQEAAVQDEAAASEQVAYEDDAAAAYRAEAAAYEAEAAAYQEAPAGYADDAETVAGSVDVPSDAYPHGAEAAAATSSAEMSGDFSDTSGEFDAEESASLRPSDAPARRRSMRSRKPDPVEDTAPHVPEEPPPAMPEPAHFALFQPETPITRPSVEPTWWPQLWDEEGEAASTGLFQFQGALPLPAAPPRPELDPSRVVRRAPLPGEEAEPPRFSQPGGDDYGAYAQEGAYEGEYLDEQAYESEGADPQGYGDPNYEQHYPEEPESER